MQRGDLAEQAAREVGYYLSRAGDAQRLDLRQRDAVGYLIYQRELFLEFLYLRQQRLGDVQFGHLNLNGKGLRAFAHAHLQEVGIVRATLPEVRALLHVGLQVGIVGIFEQRHAALLAGLFSQFDAQRL